MTNTEIVVISLFLTLVVGGFAAWVWLGGLEESGSWNVPPGAIHFLDWMVKGTFGSLMTILTQIVRRQPPLRSS